MGIALADKQPALRELSEMQRKSVLRVGETGREFSGPECPWQVKVA